MRHHNTRRTLTALALVAPLLGGCHLATNGTQTSGRVSVEGEHARVSVAFGDHERRTIRDYYGDKRNLPPGLAKRDRLPPGLAKREQLPPGLQKKVQRNERLPEDAPWKPLPDDLERRLEPVPDGYIRARVGLDVVLVDADTRVVVDVVHDISDD